MRSGSKITLGTLLGLVNGYFLGGWRFEAMNTNDVGRQWIRLIVPAMMLVTSVGLVVVVWFTDKLIVWIMNRLIGRRKTKTSNQQVDSTRP